MRVDRPVDENDIGFLAFHDLAELVITGERYFGLAVDLPCEHGAGLENLAGGLAFGRADGGRFPSRLSTDPCFARVKYSATTSCPRSAYRAIVPPQPDSGSSGCPPTTTI